MRSNGAEAIGILPNHDAIVRFVGALLLERNDEWSANFATGL
ncbi:hypothetical protein GGE07_003947 [Sinorhizobium terangae]|nr:hypothetical protein [Sinorhizobium terangae]